MQPLLLKLQQIKLLLTLPLQVVLLVVVMLLILQ